MVEFETTPLYRELQTITNNPSTPVHFTWHAKIHIGNLTYIPMKIISIDISQNYENNYADEIMLTLAISGGMYAVDIYPYKDQVEVTLVCSPLSEVGTGIDSSAPIQTERYAATIKDIGNPIVEGNTKFTPTKEALDKTVIKEIQFQLVNKALQQLRFVNVGGIYRNVTTTDIIKTVLTNESKKVKVDGARVPLGVDIAPGFNKKVRDHVIIPQGTRLVDIPEFLHVKCGGVYPTGLGYYFQDDHWYVYPCYDFTRIGTASNVLTIINVPSHKFPSIERTFRKNGKSVVILATGEVKISDDSEVQQLNAGNAVSFADANKFMNGFGNTVNNKTTLSRGGNNFEVKAQSRANGINNNSLSDNAINANPYLEFSKLARRNCSLITLVWENSLPSIIKPGALCKIMYIDNDSIKTLNGIILRCQHYVQLKERGVVSTRYVTRTSLSIVAQIVKRDV